MQILQQISRKSPRFAEKPLSVEEIEVGAKLNRRYGDQESRAGRRNALEWCWREVIESVKAVRNVSAMDIWVNVGPALTREDLVRLKELGVKEVCSSLETINQTFSGRLSPETA